MFALIHVLNLDALKALRVESIVLRFELLLGFRLSLLSVFHEVLFLNNQRSLSFYKLLLDQIISFLLALLLGSKRRSLGDNESFFFLFCQLEEGHDVFFRVLLVLRSGSFRVEFAFEDARLLRELFGWRRWRWLLLSD